MIPLYPYSFSVASDRDEVEQWRESYRENIRCQQFLDKRISELFDGWSLHGEVIDELSPVSVFIQPIYLFWQRFKAAALVFPSISLMVLVVSDILLSSTTAIIDDCEIATVNDP